MAGRRRRHEGRCRDSADPFPPLMLLASLVVVVVGVVAWGVVEREGTTVSSAPERRASPGSASTAEPAPGFRLPSLIDPSATVALSDYRGRPVVLNFWASWCTSCRREMAAFQAVYEGVGGRIEFLGINHQDDRQAALQLMHDTGMRFPSGFDPPGEVATRYGLFGLPTTVFVSPDGRVLERVQGEMSGPQLTAVLDRLFPA